MWPSVATDRRAAERGAIGPIGRIGRGGPRPRGRLVVLPCTNLLRHRPAELPHIGAVARGDALEEALDLIGGGRC